MAGGKQKGAVACGHPATAEAAAEILAEGGNAFDAAVAMGLAMTATLPSRVSLGGGGRCLIHVPGDDAVQAVDFLGQPTRSGRRLPVMIPALLRGLGLRPEDRE